jgi:hypothetical protein
MGARNQQQCPLLVAVSLLVRRLCFEHMENAEYDSKCESCSVVIC